MGIISFFKRLWPATAPEPASRHIRPELPVDVQCEIDAAQLLVREADEKGPRVICAFDGFKEFIFSDDMARKYAALLWPELTPDEAEETVRRLRIRVKKRVSEREKRVRQYIREWERNHDGRPPETWATRY
jgi:hypothetical protein